MKYEGITSFIGCLSIPIIKMLSEGNIDFDTVYQWISLGATLLLTISTVIINIVRSIHYAKEDGKITTEETKVIITEVQEGLETIKESVDSVKKD